VAREYARRKAAHPTLSHDEIEEQVLGEMRTKYVADADWPALLELILKVLALLAPFLMKESRERKPWYLSKTLWVNALTLAGSLLAVAAGSEMIAAHPQAAAAVAAGLPL